MCPPPLTPPHPQHRVRVRVRVQGRVRVRTPRQTETKKFSPRDGQNQNQNQNRKGHLGGNNNSSRKPRFENSRGSNGNKNRSNRRTGNFKQQAKEASPQVTQYQADLEIARKLQANIDAYEHNGNPTEGEWQCQSKKGAAKVKRVIG